jgi:hypothetical protein
MGPEPPPKTNAQPETSDLRDLRFSKEEIDFILSYLDRRITYQYNTKKIRV